MFYVRMLFNRELRYTNIISANKDFLGTNGFKVCLYLRPALHGLHTLTHTHHQDLYLQQRSCCCSSVLSSAWSPSSRGKSVW